MTGMTYKHTPIFSFYAEVTNEFKKNKIPKINNILQKLSKFYWSSNTPNSYSVRIKKNIQNCLFKKSQKKTLKKEIFWDFLEQTVLNIFFKIPTE